MERFLWHDPTRAAGSNPGWDAWEIFCGASLRNVVFTPWNQQWTAPEYRPGPKKKLLGGGFKDFLFLSLFGEMIQFDYVL